MYSVKISYKVCVEKTLKDRLVSFPSMLAQVESTPVQVICKANSRQIAPGNLTLFCDSNGEWNTSRLEGRCVCEQDMENREEMCKGKRVLFLTSLLPFNAFSALFCLFHPLYPIV